MATNDFIRLDVRRPSGDVDLLGPAASGANPLLIALVLEVVAVEWPNVKTVVRHPTAGWWWLDVGVELTKGMSIHVFAKEGPVAATIATAPHTKLASALTYASAISFCVLMLAGSSYFLFAGEVSGTMAILLGAATGAAVAGPLFGLAWLVDNVLNPLGPRAGAKLRAKVGERIVASFPP